MRITRLPNEVANKIAAGEVVERPASVVKELVENAIDAGAQSIAIEVLGGGLELVSVTDDGSGMSREDASIAFERHATSKIARAEDLFSINTLGFRGEALPSIASVARVRLATRERGADEGTVVNAEGGAVQAPSPAGVPHGTTVAVRDLFFNTPARLKYLRTVGTEARRVIDVAGKLALAHPEVAVSLRIDGKTAFSTPRGGDMREAVAAVLGLDIAREMLPAEHDGDGVSVRGLVGTARHARSSRDVQYVFVNGRPVSSKTVWAALDRAYDRSVPPGKRAPAVLWIEVDPSMVDVNVHPAKTEVRFAAESEVFSAVYHAVADGLRSMSAAPEAQVCQPEAVDEASPRYTPSAELRELRPSREWPRRRDSWERPASDWGYTDGPDGRGTDGSAYTADGRAGSAYEISVRDGGARLSAQAGSVGRIEVIGQLAKTYILAETDEGLIIVDQHVAHERILVDRFRREFASGAPSIQLLLSPAVVELTSGDADLVARNLDTLRKMGFDVEPFGGGSILVRGVPSHSADLDPADALGAAVEGIVAAPPGAGPESLVDNIAVSLACRGAVKAGGALRPEEMVSLLERLFAASDPYRCPHGRPVVVKVSVDYLAKAFGRK